jgi:Flp pilus assembly protein TadG
VGPRDGLMSRLILSIAFRRLRGRSPKRPVSNERRRLRRATAVVELAVLLPFLILLFLATVDFARVFYFSLTLTNCARAGALYACDPVAAVESPFPDVQSAALADATNISPRPTVSSTTGVDGSGRAYVAVTANYSFNTITQFPIIPSQVQLSRTVKMFVAPNTPNP